MDRREAIREFIVRYSKWFRLDPFPKDNFKEVRQDFFLNYAKLSPPRDREIAETALSLMIESSQIKSSEELDRILILPFFRDNVQNKDFFRDKLRLRVESPKLEHLVNRKVLEDEEKKHEILEELEKEAGERALKAKSDELKALDEEILLRREEVSSILDSLDNPVLDEAEIAKSEQEEEVEWWEQRGLTQDPFPPNTVGISNFHPDMYDQIIHETPIFIKYLSLLEKHPDKLFGNTLVYGLYGSGKSTFFEYLGSKLYRERAMAIYLSVSTAHDIETVNYDCTRQLYNKLLDVARVHGVFLTELNPNDKMESIEKIISSLARTSSVKGLVIFVEDLHKGDLDVAVQFLSDLQSLTRELKRNTGMNSICFYVESSNDLYGRIVNNPQFSGSIERAEPMPPLEIDWALDVVNRRLRAFSKNPDNPVKVNTKFIEKVFFKIKRERTPDFFTIREVLRQVALAYENGEPELIVPASTLNEIRAIIESNPLVIRPIRRLMTGMNLKPSQRDECLNLLADVYVEKGITDSELKKDSSMAKRMWYLENAGLVFRTWKNEPIFYISKPLVVLSEQTKRKYDLTIDYYIPKLYGEKKEQAKPKNLEVDFIDSILPQAPSPLSVFLEEAKRFHLDILRHEDAQLSSGQEWELAKNCVSSLASLTRAYRVFEGLSPTTDDDLATIYFWKDFWSSPEAVTKFLDTEKLIADEGRPKDFAKQLVAYYHDSFSIIIQFFKDEYEGKKRLIIPITGLTNEEIELFHECRDLLKEFLIWPRYDQINSRITKYVERKLRMFLFNAFTMYYGGRTNRIEHVDPNIRQHIVSKLQEAEQNGLTVANEFEGVNRGEYKLIMTGKTNSPEGRKNWNRIFSFLFPGWSEDRLYGYLSVGFERQDTRASHEKPIGPQQEGELYAFMRDSIEFIIRANLAHSRFISPDCVKLSSPSRAIFSLNQFKDENEILPISIESQKVKRSCERLLPKGVFEVNLEDQANVEARLLMDYRSACAVMAILQKLGQGVILAIDKKDFPRIACHLQLAPTKL